MTTTRPDDRSSGLSIRSRPLSQWLCPFPIVFGDWDPMGLIGIQQKVGGAVGELPPESESPDQRFLQAQSRICLRLPSVPRPNSRRQQFTEFRASRRTDLNALAGLVDGDETDPATLSCSVANLD